jgi:CheY-like chemotaxis protein
MKKILIVEDDSDFREILHRFIIKLGHHTIKARNSKEAIECAEAEQPDLIFMDLDLPDADGIKTTAILRQNPKTSHIPVVAITAWISALWQEEAEKVGIATYLIKPISARAIRVRAVMRVFQMLKETIEEYTHGSLIRGEV